MTTSDGYSIYATAIIFYEDLSLIEQSIKDHEFEFQIEVSDEDSIQSDGD